VTAGKVATVKLLFIGDVVGSPGRRGLAAAMPGLRERFDPELTVVNGENSAGGMGITEKTALDIFDAGADVITLGNHTYRHRDAYEYLDRATRVIRPANYRRSNPGRGSVVVEAGGMRIGVINLSGTVGLSAARSAFDEADLLVESLDDSTDALVVDFHAEVTSEKVALGWYLDGRVAAVLGTHTHVPTADARVLTGGTAFISDVGMTGSRDGVLGVKREQAIERMRTDMPARFETATEDVWVMGAAVEINDRGLADSIEPFMLPAP
jgi:metallophosphoesterase (TIGR00282 family)